MLRWYLIHTKPMSEALARMHLERQGYEVYLPRVEQPVRRRGRWHQKIAALFPRYLFLRLSEGQQALNPVRFTSGVAGVVRFGSRYAIVPDRVVAELRSRAGSSGLHRLRAVSSFSSGATVRIDAGAFEGLEGVFERQAGADRVLVLLRLLGREASVCVPLDFLPVSYAL